jgi:hypothetical protein
LYFHTLTLVFTRETQQHSVRITPGTDFAFPDNHDGSGLAPDDSDATLENLKAKSPSIPSTSIYANRVIQRKEDACEAPYSPLIHPGAARGL